MTEHIGPRVKQLVWEPCDTYKLTAWSPFGSYNIDECDGFWAFNHDVYGDFFEKMADHELPEEDAIDELKAAAQADFEQRIRSELEPAPSVSEAASELIDAVSDLGLRNLVAGWNGEDKTDGPYKPHPDALSATIKTNCGTVYRIDAALRALQQESGDASVSK